MLSTSFVHASKKGALSLLLFTGLAQVSQAADVVTPFLSLSAPSVQSDSYPNEDAWYNSRGASFHWDLPQSVSAVRTLYDHKPDTVPSKVYDPPVTSKSFIADEDGVFYLHVQFKDESGWGEIAHRKFQIDTQAPYGVAAHSVDGEVTTSVNPRLRIDATDDLSGVDHFNITLDNGTPSTYPYVPSGVYTLMEVPAGEHIITVAVADKAGNKTEVRIPLTIEKLDTPAITSYTRRAETAGKVIISGTTYPNGSVQVLLTDEDGNTFGYETTAGTDGSFTLTVPQKLAAGVYDVRARAVNDNGAASDYTDQRTLLIENAKFIRIGAFIVNWLSLVLIIILAGALILATLWYAVLQFSRFRRKIYRTMKEADMALRANVAALRRDTEEFHTLLLKAEKKRELTKEEQSILKKFKKRLDSTEKDIEKKLKQIG